MRSLHSRVIPLRNPVTCGFVVLTGCSAQILRACSHYPQRFYDERKAEERKKDDVQFFETGEDAAEAFESAEQSFDLVALLVKGAIVLPGLQPVALRRDYRNHAQIEHQLPGFISFVGAIHQQWKAFRHGT